MWEDLNRLLTDFLPDVDEQTLILKITEESGEVAEAYIGMRGQNPRKGVCATRDDVQTELADVVITTAIAMIALADGNPDVARAHLHRRLADVIDRAGV